jgi:hypothetical protein
VVTTPALMQPRLETGSHWQKSPIVVQGTLSAIAAAHTGRGTGCVLGSRGPPAVGLNAHRTQALMAPLQVHVRLPMSARPHVELHVAVPVQGPAFAVPGGQMPDAGGPPPAPTVPPVPTLPPVPTGVDPPVPVGVVPPEPLPPVPAGVEPPVPAGVVPPVPEGVVPPVPLAAPPVPLPPVPPLPVLDPEEQPCAIHANDSAKIEAERTDVRKFDFMGKLLGSSPVWVFGVEVSAEPTHGSSLTHLGEGRPRFPR